MTPADTPMEKVLRALQERAKELDCLYRIDELLKHTEAPLDEILRGLVLAIPPGYQFQTVCEVRITLKDQAVQSRGFVETAWSQSAEVVTDGQVAGRIDVCYREPVPRSDEGPFLKEERKLLSTIAEHLGSFITHQRLRTAFRSLEAARASDSTTAAERWRTVLEFVRRTDQALLDRITRKMLNHLCWNGVREAVPLLYTVVHGRGGGAGEVNRPSQASPVAPPADLTEATFAIATGHMNEDEILSCIQEWIREERARFLVSTIANPDSSLDEISDAIRRFHLIPKEEVAFPEPVRKGLVVSLIEHFFTDQLAFLQVAKRFIDVDDYFDIVQHLIFPPRSRGKLGGKSAGLFLANRILERVAESSGAAFDVKVPKAWYLATDGILDFIQFNSLEDAYNQKYADIDQTRDEYPHIVQIFKNSTFPPSLMNGLSTALDDLEGRPLIVRSSSLLEDRFGAAFSGKYKSLFLANQGTKQERLAALTDAIAEVYASTFAPDPIEYRTERGLIDVYEEMGILIQEVVGTRVGRYFLPSFSGVAFSRNEFRWSARIRREDGLVRMVPGLGTRAVDRLKDDYPVLLAPGQPNLRVNATTDEIVRYSPRRIDVIDLERGAFETISIRDFLAEAGAGLPQFANMVSVVEEDRIRPPLAHDVGVDASRLVVTFDGLVRNTPFIRKIREILEVLEREIGAPVDIEFASDGTDLYLLQCRPQSSSPDARPAPIPRDIPTERIVFSAHRFVSNGVVPDLSHVVYVDPDRYSELESLEDLRAVGQAVGRLNKLLPKRRFALIGPGRWGSRGDIRLGVNVTYADISNTALLIEVARRKETYLPELSFGTHFFQDLVESSIRYLPLYPDDAGVRFDEAFLRDSPSVLADLLPDFARLADVVRVVDVARAQDGMVLRVLLNADLDLAVGFLSPPEDLARAMEVEAEPGIRRAEAHWRWRQRFAERLASSLDGARFGVKALYLFGSTKNASAGPASDIDLLIHFEGTEEQKRDLLHWLEGWSRCLSEMNFLRTGYRVDGLLDVHLLGDREIAERTSFAAKIGAVTDAAHRLRLQERGPEA
jgi:hypothetical protein